MMAGTSLTGKRVLIVDDSATVRTFIAALLRNYGAQVEGVATGQECRERLEADAASYDLILLDLILPDTDGIQLLRELRRRSQDPTVVVLTGVGGVRSAIASVREGADGYLQKEEISVGGDHDAFVYHLEQAMERRAGLLAAKQLERVRAEMYAMVAHDLRSPTSTIQLALELLRDPDTGPLNDMQRELLDAVADASARLHSLIRDYLDFIGLENGSMNLTFDWVDPVPLVEESVHMIGVQARFKGQQVEVNLPKEQELRIWADSQRLKQVFDNLLSNAVKYTPEGGQIWVRLALEGNRLRFQVTDTGIGLESDLIPRLFARFQRADNEAARAIQGTGLGLFIVREIVEAHGGEVQAESPGPGQGSTFTVWLPIESEDAPRALNTATAHP